MSQINRESNQTQLLRFSHQLHASPSQALAVSWLPLCLSGGGCSWATLFSHQGRAGVDQSLQLLLACHTAVWGSGCPLPPRGMMRPWDAEHLSPWKEEMGRTQEDTFSTSPSLQWTAFHLFLIKLYCEIIVDSTGRRNTESLLVSFYQLSPVVTSSYNVTTRKLTLIPYNDFIQISNTPEIIPSRPDGCTGQEISLFSENTEI